MQTNSPRIARAICLVEKGKEMSNLFKTGLAVVEAFSKHLIFK